MLEFVYAGQVVYQDIAQVGALRSRSLDFYTFSTDHLLYRVCAIEIRHLDDG